MILSEDYTHFSYDEKDLEADDRVPYWFYAAGHTPPGMSHKPFYEWTWMNHCSRGFRYAAEKLSLPYTLGTDHRSYHGYEIVRVAVPDAELKKRRSEGFRESIKTFLDNYDVRWDNACQELMGYYKELKNFDAEKATWFELELILEKLLEVDQRMWEIHMYFGCGLGAVYLLFEDICRELLQLEDTDTLFHNLMGGFDNKLNEVEKKLFLLSRRVKELALSDLFAAYKGTEVLSKLEESESGKQWLKEFNEFLWDDGWRTTYIFEYEPSWIEDPAPALGSIRQYLKCVNFVLDEMAPKIVNERMEAEEEILRRVSIDRRGWFKSLMVCAQKYNSWNESHEYYCELYCYAITRHILLKIGQRLLRAGTIDKADDVLFLVPEELHKGLSDASTYRLQRTVHRRRRQWLENNKIVPPPMLGRVSIEEAGRLLFEGREPFITKVSIGDVVSPVPGSNADLFGLSASPGIVEGPARVIFSPDDIGEVKEGEILVTPSTSAPWVSVFSLIKGVVTDRGGTLSHAAIQGRQFGIPVVGNVVEGTSKIKTGQRIKVDGNLGLVYILKEDEKWQQK